MTCPKCKKSKMRLKYNKQGGVFGACTGYPDCKTTMSVPHCLEAIKMLDQTCESCRRRGMGEVRLFKLDFQTEFVNPRLAEILPAEDNTSGTFCLNDGCDPQTKSLNDLTFGMGYQQAIPKTNNNFQPNYNGRQAPKAGNAPNYYYQKPMLKTDFRNKEQEAAQPQKQKGCELCGKQRHTKTSTCPNAKK